MEYGIWNEKHVGCGIWNMEYGFHGLFTGLMQATIAVNMSVPTAPSTSTLVFPDVPEDIIYDGMYILSSAPLRPSTFSAPLLFIECRPDDEIIGEVDPARVKVVESYQCLVPKVCVDANEGQKMGSWSRSEFPGIPDKKYSLREYSELADQPRCWYIQAIFEKFDAKEFMGVQYEGFATLVDQDLEEVKESAPEAFFMFQVKEAFLKQIERIGSDQQKRNARRERTMEENGQYAFFSQSHPFWLLQDLSYYHTVVQRQFRLGPLFYIALDGKSTPTPFSYSPINVFKSITYKRCVRRRENLPFVELIKNKKISMKGMKPSSCENGMGCVCDKRFTVLYLNKSVNLQPDKDGLLDFEGFDPDVNRIVMECSDVCGCSSNCPRRSLQRGQQMPIVVFHEGESGFGLRCAEPIKKGQFICEYTGEGYYKRSGKDQGEDIAPPKKSTSYESDFKTMDPRLIICAKRIGNVARFFNHRCDPNTVFVETYSRQLESDVLIPRISVYALKDIGVGDQMTLCYYNLSTVKVDKRGVECKCGSYNCIKYLPMNDDED